MRERIPAAMLGAESEDRMNAQFHSIKLLFLAGAIAVGYLLPGQAKADTAIVAGGCFWCVESNFESVPGVSGVVSGFTGGATKDPTYDDVSYSDTGHFESVEITFDPAKVAYATQISLFLHSTDVLDDGGQFCDRGKPYRTAIFVTPEQAPIAQAELDKAAAELGKPLVTQILPAQTFYPADAYHQDYYKQTSYVFTRNGPKTKASAYDFYRKACGRDARVEELWGSAAKFLH